MKKSLLYLASIFLASCGSINVTPLKSITAPVTEDTWSVRLKSTSTNLWVMEGSSAAIVLLMTEKAKTAATFTWSIVPNDGRFELAQGSGSLAKGEESFSFIIKPVDDGLFQGNSDYTLEIAGSNFSNKISLDVTVLDDESNTSPTITSISPTNGTSLGGTTITITGTHFLTGATATVDGNPCTSPTVVSYTSFTCVTPSGTAGAVDVVLTNTLAAQPTGTRAVTEVGGFTYRNDTWNFGTVSDFTFDATLFSTSLAQNKATLSPLQLIHNTQTKFDDGTHVGTVHNGTVLKLNAATAVQTEHASGWTPKWASLVSYWKANNDWLDAVGSNDLTASGATFSTTARLGSHSANFDGVNDEAAIADASTGGTLDFASASFSYSAWVYVPTSSAGTEDSPLSKGGAGGTAGYLMLLGTGAWESQISDGVTTKSCSFGSELLNQWVYVSTVVDRTANLLRCYTNGVQNSSTDITGLGSTSNAASFKLGAYSTSFFKGRVDDAAVWGAALSAGDVSLIYHRQKQKYSGIFTAEVMDANSASDFIKMNWVSSLPFGKALPGDTDSNGSADAESASDYSSITSGGEDLASNLQGLWHMDESSWNGTANESVDSSGKGRHLTAQGSASVTTDGLFANGALLDGSTQFMQSSSFNFNAINEITVSIWAKNTLATPSATQGLFLKRTQVFMLAAKSDSKIQVCLTNNSAWHCKTSTLAFTDWNKWHHYVATYDGTTLRMYRDGVKLDEFSETGALTSSSGYVWLGKSSSNIHFQGSIDEAAVWTRKLTDAEVIQLYRRGANRNKFQVRTCTQSDCSDEPEFIGPDKSATTWFSELHNAAAVASTGQGSGTVQLTSPLLDFTKWIASVVGWTFNPAPAQYFQYRILMESDDENNLCSSAPCFSDVSSVNAVTAVAITTDDGRAFPSALTQFRVTRAGDCGTEETVRFQVSSDDGSTYKYWNGSAWTVAAAGVYSQAANYTLTNANIATLASSGTFRFKAIMPSQFGKTCELSSPYIQW